MTTHAFSLIVGNPPYNVNTGKDITATHIVSKEVYHEFELLAHDLSRFSSIIAPANWQKDIKTPPATDFFEGGLRQVHNYSAGEVFSGDVDSRVQLAIMFREAGYKGDIGLRDGGIATLGQPVWIPTKHKKAIWDATRHLPPVSLNVSFPIPWSNMTEVPISISANLKHFKNPVSIYIKRLPGKQPDGGDFFMDENELLKVLPEIKTEGFKVAIRSRIFCRISVWENSVVNRKVGSHIDAKVYGPREFFGTTYGLLRTFDNLEEAENFRDYLNTEFATNLIGLNITRKSFASQLPELESYRSDNPLFERPEGCENFVDLLNERLYEFFGVS